MGTKIIFCLACLIFSACAVSTESQQNTKNEVKYAISYCLATSYPKSEFSKDAGYIAGAYIEKGDYGLDMYEKIRDFVSTYKTKKYTSKHDRNLEIMQCINLLESNELKLLIEKIANESIQPTA